jgi:Flp pilus assembly protein TadG
MICTVASPGGASPTARHGAAMVELALVLPVIFIVFLGAIEVTRLNFLRHTATNVAYEAARTVIVPGSVPSEGQTLGMTLLEQVGAGNNSTVTVSRIGSDRVRAEVRIPLRNNSWGVTMFFDGALVQACTLTRESND